MTVGLSSSVLGQGLQRFLTAVSGGSLVVYKGTRPAKGQTALPANELARLTNVTGVLSGTLLTLSIPAGKATAAGIPVWARFIGSDTSFVADLDVPGDVVVTYGSHNQIDVGSNVSVVQMSFGTGGSSAVLVVNAASAVASFAGTTQTIIWSGLPSLLSIPQGGSVNLGSYCTSTLGYALTFTSTPLPSGVTLAANGVLSVSAGAPAVTTNSIQFTANDGHGNTKASAIISIRVVLVSASEFSYLGAIQLPKDPADNATQYTFGSKTAPVYIPGPNGRKVYILGGSVNQAAGSGPGSQTMFTFNNATGTLAVDYPYVGAVGDVQPSHPNGVALTYNPAKGNGRIDMVAGATS